MITENTYRFERSIPIDQPYDIVIAGGGPAGAIAAIVAGRLGARTLLLEATGSLGGMGTNAYVSQWFSMGNNEFPTVGGLVVELCQALYERKAVDPRRGPECWTGRRTSLGFNPEALKLLLDEKVIGAGVEIRYETRVIDVDCDADNGVVHGVVINNVEGHRYIPAKAFIDATGNAVLTDLCGAPCREAGRDTPNIMPPTLCAAISDVDYTRFDRHSMQQNAVDKALAEGIFSQPDRHVPGLFRSGETTGTLNAGHLFNMNALNNRSLSDGYIKGRQLVAEYVEFFQKYLPGCENITAMSTGSIMGVRESRRIVGEYELNYDDFQNRRSFPDQIAIYCKEVDIHVYAPTEEEYARFHQEFTSMDRIGDGEYYGLPYGILVPKGWTNLWVAGRCNSSDLKVNGAIRDQPACMMMGQAAATAAVQHIRTGEPAHGLNTVTLVNSLREQGANLPQEKVVEKMTKD